MRVLYVDALYSGFDVGRGVRRLCEATLVQNTEV
jgi:hypothetical protein